MLHSTQLPPVLDGRKVRLIPLTPEHVTALALIAFDPAIWRYMVQWITTPADLDAWLARAFAEQAAGRDLPWVTLDKRTGKIIGSTRLTELDLHHQTSEIGHTWLIPAAQGTGVNTEAKLLQLTYAFETLHLVRVAFRTHHANLRSQAAIRALGAKEEGTFRNHYLMPDGTRRHTVWFSLTQKEWPAAKLRLEKRVKPNPPA